MIRPLIIVAVAACVVFASFLFSWPPIDDGCCHTTDCEFVWEHMDTSSHGAAMQSCPKVVERYNLTVDCDKIVYGDSWRCRP